MKELLSNKLNNKKSWVSSKIDTHIFSFIDIAVMLLIILSVLVFILWPIASVIFKSIIIDGTISFDMYKDLFQKNGKILWNSLFVSTLSTIITVLFSISIALYERYSKNILRKIILPVLMLTMISPPFVSSLAYITLFGRRGFITHKLLGLTISPYGWHGLVLMQALSEISISTLIIIGVLKGIDKNLIQASFDLGSNSSETIKRVIMPLVKPGIIVAAFIAFVKSLADFGTPIIIGGGFKVLATEAYLSVISRSNLPKASAMNVLIVLPALIVFLFYRYFMKNQQLFSNTASKATDSSESELKLNRWVNIVLGIITWTFVIVMLLQYIAIFLSAITYYNGSEIVFTMKYIKAMKYGKMGSFFRSIRYSFVAGIVTSIIGLLLSYYIERKKVRGLKALDFMATLPYIIPGTFFGIGYVLAFNDYPLPLTGTSIIVVLNCIFRQIPIATKAGSAVLTNINPEIENAAKDLGTANIFVLKDIIFPLLKPAFLISFINTFTTTMTTVGAIIFIISPGAKVATVEMFNTLRDGDYGIGAVIANMIILSTLIINFTFSKIMVKKEQ